MFCLCRNFNFPNQPVGGKGRLSSYYVINLRYRVRTSSAFAFCTNNFQNILSGFVPCRYAFDGDILLQSKDMGSNCTMVCSSAGCTQIRCRAFICESSSSLAVSDLFKIARYFCEIFNIASIMLEIFYLGPFETH